MKKLLSCLTVAALYLFLGFAVAQDGGGDPIRSYDASGVIRAVRPDYPLSVQSPFLRSISATQTVTASSAYSSGNAVGGKITFSGAVRAAAGGGQIQSCALRDKAGQSVAYDLFILNADPSATTVTDKSAVAVNTADLSKIVGVVKFATANLSLGAASTMGVITSSLLGLSFTIPSGTTLYGILVTRGTPTYASTSDVTVACVVAPDQ